MELTKREEFILTHLVRKELEQLKHYADILSDDAASFLENNKYREELRNLLTKVTFK